MTNTEYIIAAFYRFVKLPDYTEFRDPLRDFCNKQGLKGTILLAEEGINSTISGTRSAIDALFERFDADPRLRDIPRKEHTAGFQPFERMKVRLKKEIVRLDAADVMHVREEDTGTYVSSKDWDTLLADPEVTVIDTRNDYEVKLGKFAGAINPHTEEFRALPQWVKQHLDPKKNKKVAMYCTGGIRCEKSTALLKNMGFENVYHLQGGILQYLADTKNARSLWEGDCFVFDDRIAVNDALQPTHATLCRKCSSPVVMADPEQRRHNHRGIICNDCRQESAKQQSNSPIG